MFSNNIFALFKNRERRLPEFNCKCPMPKVKKPHDLIMFCVGCDAIVETEFCLQHRNAVCSKCHCKKLKKIVGGYTPSNKLNIGNPPRHE